jgi:hypothetical protein
MSGIKDSESLDDVRKRLYERSTFSNVNTTHKLSDVKHEAPTHWQEPPKPIVMAPVAHSTLPAVVSTERMPIKRKRGYRTKILIAGFSFFGIALLLSSMFLLFGRNNISGENIAIGVTGPFTVGGGEELQLQVGITNDNGVPIDVATLIVEYPNGTKSAVTEGKDLFTERLALETIKAGETVNVPVRARVFGEENEEKTVRVSIEYRVKGSNATFFKEAEPMRFKISSSPIIMRAESVKKLSSGQEADITLTIVSNSPTPLSELLVKAEYPSGFDFSKSSPSPTHGQNMWLIKNLEPEKEQKIVITGVLVGKESDEHAMKFTVGVPNERDPQSLASIFSTAETQFEIEQPFLDIAVKVNSSEEAEIAVEPGKRSTVVTEIANSTEDTLNDVSVEVGLTGNAISIFEVSPQGGYYDSSKNTILWDVANTPELGEIIPGSKRRVSFSVEPASGVNQTPQININVDAKARRVSENRVAEELVGSAKRTIKVISTPKLVGVVSHNNGIFGDIGPVPPVADKATTYTVSMVIENGSNTVTDAIVTASLPAYVTWLDKIQGVGKIAYNSTTRALEWSAGEVAPNAETYISFQVSALPRTLQIGTVPILVGEQRLKAVDRFTGTTVRATSDAVTTGLPSEGGNNEDSGRVRASETD